MKMPRKTMPGIAPIQYQWFVLMPYLAPLAVCPKISSEPRFADIKAMPVTQCESDRFVRRKSSDVRILLFRKYPTPRTTAKYEQIMAMSSGLTFINMVMVADARRAATPLTRSLHLRLRKHPVAETQTFMPRLSLRTVTRVTSCACLSSGTKVFLDFLA